MNFVSVERFEMREVGEDGEDLIHNFVGTDKNLRVEVHRLRMQTDRNRSDVVGNTFGF